MANDIVLGTLKITRTYRALGIEWEFTGDDDADSTVLLYFRKAGDSTWRDYVNNVAFGTGAPVGLNRIIPSVASSITVYGDQRAFYGSIFDLDAGTSYDLHLVVADPDGVTVGATVSTTLNGVPVADSTRTVNGATSATIETTSGAVVTRVDNAPSRATVLAATTHHLNAVTGNDSNAGTSSGAAWKTFAKAWASAPSGAVVKVYGGSLAYQAPNTTRTLPITLIADNSAVDGGGRNGADANVGSQVVVEDGPTTSTSNELYGTAPTGTTPDANYPAGRVGPWTQVTDTSLIGGTGDRTLWTFDIRAGGVQTLASGDAVSQMGYGSTRQGLRRRIPNYKSSSTQCDTLLEFANLLFQTYNPGVTNTQQWGFWAHPTSRHLVYVRLPGDANPNSYWTTIGGGNGLVFGAGSQDSRVSGLHLRGFGSCIETAQGTAPDRGMVDQCRLANAFAGVRFDAFPPSSWTTDWTIQDCLFGDSDMWVAGNLSINRGFIKSDMTGTTGGPKLGANEENAAVYFRGGSTRLTFRRNRVVQMFNGLTALNTVLSGGNFNRYATSDIDIYECSFEGIGDDCIEPETVAINWRAWDCTVKDSFQVLSATPMRFGPLYLARFDCQNTPSADGIDVVGVASLVGNILKMGSTSPTDLVPEIFILYSTWYSAFAAAESVQQANNSGGSTQPRIYLWGNVGRVGRYAVESAAAGHWFEDYDFLGTSDAAAKSISYAGINRNLAAYRTASSQGTHTNKLGGTDYEINGAAVTKIVAELADPSNDNLLPKVASALIAAGAVRGNVADVADAAPSRLYHYSGAAPSLGYREIDYVAAAPTTGDTTPPVISSILAVPLANGATISWTTDESADTQIEYGLTTAYGTFSTLKDTAPFNTSHTDLIPSLTASTTYHYRVRSRDSAGNLTVSADQTFTTLQPTAPGPTGSARTPVARTPVARTPVARVAV